MRWWRGRSDESCGPPPLALPCISNMILSIYTAEGSKGSWFSLDPTDLNSAQRPRLCPVTTTFEHPQLPSDPLFTASKALHTTHGQVLLSDYRDAAALS